MGVKKKVTCAGRIFGLECQRAFTEQFGKSEKAPAALRWRHGLSVDPWAAGHGRKVAAREAGEK